MSYVVGETIHMKGNPVPKVIRRVIVMYEVDGHPVPIHESEIVPKETSITPRNIRYNNNTSYYHPIPILHEGGADTKL